MPGLTRTLTCVDNLVLLKLKYKVSWAHWSINHSVPEGHECVLVLHEKIHEWQSLRQKFTKQQDTGLLNHDDPKEITMTSCLSNTVRQ